MAHLVYASEDDAVVGLKKLLSFFPQNNGEKPPVLPCQDPAERFEEKLNAIVPDNPNKPYDMKEIISLLVDNGDFFEIQPMFAPNILVGFASSTESVGDQSPKTPKVKPVFWTTTLYQEGPVRRFAKLKHFPFDPGGCPRLMPGPSGYGRDHPQRRQLFTPSRRRLFQDYLISASPMAEPTAVMNSSTIRETSFAGPPRIAVWVRRRP